MSASDQLGRDRIDQRASMVDEPQMPVLDAGEAFRSEYVCPVPGRGI
jgi:hypothetical protein